MDSSVIQKLVGLLQDIVEPAVAILPLALLLGAVKTISTVDNFIGRLTGGVGKAAGGAGEGLSKKIESGRNLDSLEGRGVFGKTPAGALRRFKVREENKAAGRDSELKRSRASYHADLIQSDEKYRNAVAGGTFGSAAEGPALNRALANAINVKAQIEADEVKAATAIIKNADLNMDQIRNLAKGGDLPGKGLDGSDLAVRRAAMQQVVKANSVDGINELVNESLGWAHANSQNATPEQKEMGSKLRATLSESLNDSSYRPAWLSKGVIAGIENGENDKNTSQLIQQAVVNNTYSPRVTAKADKDELRDVATEINNMLQTIGPLDEATTNGINNTIKNATMAIEDDRLVADVGKNLAAVQKISNITPR